MHELLFHGAAGEVTGSMHMLRFDDRWIALDCGLYQGRRSESEEKNNSWPVDPKDISAVLLSHAHTDHAGRLPKLVKDGFEGDIFCTPATRDLCAIMLPDSAHIQEEDVFYVNKRRKKKGLEPIEPLYTYEHALGAVTQMNSTPYERWFQVIEGVYAKFNEAGHMLGSAGIRIEFGKRSASSPTLYYTGDVGRPNKPIIRDPKAFPPADVVICESTYGGRVNEQIFDSKDKVRDIVRRVIGRGGKVIIPAFSVGRTQTIVYFLHEQMVAGELPRFPIWVDSPLSVNATEVFRLHPECYDAEARSFHRVTGDILGSGVCTYIRDVEKSKELNRSKESGVIISASGMCEAGRIRHHLKNNIENENNAVIIPGWQAAHTLGRRIVEGAEKIRMFHEDFTVNAEVHQVHGFSGHADQADLLRLMEPLAGETSQVYLVHGEEDQSTILRDKFTELGLPKVEVAQPGMKRKF